jgi:hypothetical protein
MRGKRVRGKMRGGKRVSVGVGVGFGTGRVA